MMSGGSLASRPGGGWLGINEKNHFRNFVFPIVLSRKICFEIKKSTTKKLWKVNEKLKFRNFDFFMDAKPATGPEASRSTLRCPEGL